MQISETHRGRIVQCTLDYIEITKRVESTLYFCNFDTYWLCWADSTLRLVEQVKDRVQSPPEVPEVLAVVEGLHLIPRLEAMAEEVYRLALAHLVAAVEAVDHLQNYVFQVTAAVVVVAVSR